MNVTLCALEGADLTLMLSSDMTLDAMTTRVDPAAETLFTSVPDFLGEVVYALTSLGVVAYANAVGNGVRDVALVECPGVEVSS